VCSLLILLTVVAAGAPAESVTATRLDGASVVGQLHRWVDQQLIVATDKGSQTLATDELVSVRWPSTPTTDDSDQVTTSMVELTDGTILPANDIHVAEDRLSMSLAISASVEQKPVVIPVKRVAAVRFEPLKATAAEQWQEIRHQQRTSDVLLAKHGENLDGIDGVLGDITADKIGFKLDGDELQVDRDKVAGFIYFRRGNAAQPESPCVLHGRNGLRMSAAQVRLEESVLHVKLVSGLELDVPLAEIELADFSAGKIRYLSDVAESTFRWTPLVALPADASQAAGYGQPRRDRSAYGGPLTLQVSTGDSQDTTSPLQIFSKGLALRSRTELVYRLPAGFGRFTAVAGMEPATSSTGNVHLAIYGDDRPLFEADISGQEPPRAIELDIAGVKRLKIVVDFGKNLDTGDWLNLCDARLLK
jgi:hypothetical protein